MAEGGYMFDGIFHCSACWEEHHKGTITCPVCARHRKEGDGEESGDQGKDQRGAQVDCILAPFDPE